ncbi:hypothetical protein [Paenibacillus periandrae]|uniref:hypothetical protein n=1 Tax=Paenibacillus periandrae TaxID=1761741 RepID=UPI001F0916C4|nr:hypothetical protein [Paenibacillus periandrae]
MQLTAKDIDFLLSLVRQDKIQIDLMKTDDFFGINFEKVQRLQKQLLSYNEDIQNKLLTLKEKISEE